MTDAQVISLASILFPLVASLCAYLYKRYVPASEQAKLAHASSVVGMVVQAVEQACAAMEGNDKKAEAMRIINQLLSEAKIKISPVLVDALIEQAVYAVNQAHIDNQDTKIIPVVKA